MPAGPKPIQPRGAKSAYRGKNGFVHPTRDRLNSATTSGTSNPTRTLHAIAADLTNATEQERRELGDAVDRHAVMERALELKGSYFPSYVVHLLHTFFFYQLVER